MPFQKLMEQVEALGPFPDVTMGELSERWGEEPLRIMDAVTAVRVLHGERTYISLEHDR